MNRSSHYARRSARVLLLDGAGRILLLRCYLDAERPELTAWFTPGGGVRPGERPADAAARELLEEIGLHVRATELGLPVAETSGYAELGWITGVMRDDFFLHRVSTHDVDGSRLEPRERAAIIEHRWWSADELATATDTVYPFGLAALVADLTSGKPPRQPIRLPWHH